MSSQQRESSPASPLRNFEAGAIEAAVPPSPEGEQKPEPQAMLTTQQRLYFLCVSLFGLLVVYLRQTIAGMGGNDITYTLLVLAVCSLCPRGGAAKVEQEDSRKSTAVRSSAAQMASDVEGQVRKRASPSPRLHYLDNLKSFMTFSVVAVHIFHGYGGPGPIYGFVIGNFRNWFGGISSLINIIGQSCGMCLFFFISGYFTPSSLARKGMRDFIREKFMRLGLPLFAFFFIFNGFIEWFSVTVVMGKTWPAATWPVGLGPAWFLQVLLLYIIGFALCMGSSELPTVRCPSPGILIVLGAGLGLVQFWFVKLDFSMWSVPLANGIGSVAFDPLFFIGGCLAKKNKWLEEFQETMRPGSWALSSLRFGTTFLILLFAIYLGGTYHQEMFLSGRRLEAAVSLAWSMDDVVPLIVLPLFGVMTMAMSMSVITLFSFYGNFVSKTSKFFSEAAFGVYFMHAAVWQVVSYSYVELLRAGGFQMTFSVFADGQKRSSDDIGALYLLLGFLYTLSISNLILWPLAFYLRKLPGFRHVL